MSRTRGIRSSTTVSSVSSAAARAGNAEFFDPLVAMLPLSGAPPSITNLSILRLFFPALGLLFPARYRFPNIVARGSQHFTCIVIGDARCRRHDSSGSVQQFRIL